MSFSRRCQTTAWQLSQSLFLATEYTGDTEFIGSIKDQKKKKTTMTKQWTVFLLLVVTIFASACRNAKKEVPGTMVTGKGTIAADEALLPLINAELDVFHSQYNFASIECKYGSEYDAINQLLQEKVRLAIVTRPLNQQETDYFKSKDIFPESIALAYDAIAVIIHPENTLRALTTRQIAGILSGQIVNWSQVENSGKTGSIKQVLDTESSGIIRSLVDSLKLNEKISGKF